MRVGLRVREPRPLHDELVPHRGILGGSVFNLFFLEVFFFKPLEFHGRASRDLHLLSNKIGSVSRDLHFSVDKILKKAVNISKMLFLFF